MALGDSVEAERCAAAVNGNVAGDIELYCGMTAEQLEAFTEAILEWFSEEREAQIAAAAGVQRIAIIGLARRIAVDVETMDQAIIELDRAVAIAVEVQREGRGSD
ncbi:MAG: hypothetical protein AAFZ09_09855, partial [Pseudomonadota bacterium]